MNAMLEPRMVVARIQPPFAAEVSSCGPARIRASSQGGLAILAINQCPQDGVDLVVWQAPRPFPPRRAPSNRDDDGRKNLCRTRNPHQRKTIANEGLFLLWEPYAGK